MLECPLATQPPLQCLPYPYLLARALSEPRPCA